MCRRTACGSAPSPRPATTAPLTSWCEAETCCKAPRFLAHLMTVEWLAAVLSADISSTCASIVSQQQGAESTASWSKMGWC